MSERTPGIAIRYVKTFRGFRQKPKIEPFFGFDLSVMTLATALADPRASHDTQPSWTFEQLFRVMLEPRNGANRAEIQKLLPQLMVQFVGAITTSPFNEEAIKFALHKDSKGRVTGLNSTYPDPKNPDKTKSTVICVSTHLTLLEPTRNKKASFSQRVRDDLFQRRDPSGSFLSYVIKFRELRLDPLLRLIQKNDEDVHKVLTAMAHVKQIDLALAFAEDCFKFDRSSLWSDFEEAVQPLEVSKQDLEQLYWKGPELWDGPLPDSKQLDDIRDFRSEKLAPLLQELGDAAAWAHAGTGGGAQVLASVTKRDNDAKRVLFFLRTDAVLLEALEDWDSLNALDQMVLGGLVEDLLGALAQCPGALQDLLDSEFCAAAEGMANLVTPLAFPTDSTRQKVLSHAFSNLDLDDLVVKKPNDLTKVIKKLIQQYNTTKRIARPILSIWAHSTPAILARFDKQTPGRVNPKGTAYLLRSVFGMGLLTKDEMNELWRDLDSVLESAVTHGPSHPTTKSKIKRIFNTELRVGKYPLRSSFWDDRKLFSSAKLAVGLVAVRQGVISVVDKRDLSEEDFLGITSGILSVADGARGLASLLDDMSAAGRSGIRHPSALLSKLPPAVLITKLGALVSLASAYHGLKKTTPSSKERDFATADVAVAWISLGLVAFEATLGTPLLVAGLAVIFLRWVLFDETLWNKIGNVASAPPIVDLVRATTEKLQNSDEKLGDILKLAPNVSAISQLVEDIVANAPETAEKHQASELALFFNLVTEHKKVIRRYATRSYGLTKEAAELIIEE